MGNVAIHLEQLGKKYQIAGHQIRHDRLGDQLLSSLSAPFRKAKNVLRGRAEGAAGLTDTIWALKDVSFEITHGEAVGIIGRNGAGKSTLLKILSQITEPSTGYADIYGRVGSLLEVGTGFHPELTGRENVYLNGAILGMSRKEIQRKFDQIVDFADIERFIDTPVKHYSSGMYVRLAFSVAAHLQPEILLVDEVLAVGDAAFQRKCLDKMDEVAQGGRTVVFVSHNMGLVQTLCERGIYIDNGQVVRDGPIRAAVGDYLSSLSTAATVPVALRTDRRGNGMARIIAVEVSGENRSDGTLEFGRGACFRFEADRPVQDMSVTFELFDEIGQRLTAFHSRDRGHSDNFHSSKDLVFECFIDQFPLLPGEYSLSCWLTGDNALLDGISAAAIIRVVDGDMDGRIPPDNVKFSVIIPHRWRLPANAF